jgi:hypothetical protein
MGGLTWRATPPWGKVEAKLKELGLDQAGAIRSGSHHLPAVLYQFEPDFCPPGEMLVLAPNQSLAPHPRVTTRHSTKR